ncbi:putative stress-response protein [Criblamydia sequanensis CRIB-18]|uniref:Stress-response protein n=1 Tax=Candidatus Criblamydia sequanensis CRIB-18 TaxID=1437425 RepID=A0A090DW12_9BACT|nr:putative stress-response protein [Criblamydia sequanensis CRIB-18]
MNKDVFQGQWNILKGKVKEQWGKLTDDDLKEINGKREQLLGKIQKRYGYAKDRAEKEIKTFEEEFATTGASSHHAHESGAQSRGSNLRGDVSSHYGERDTHSSTHKETSRSDVSNPSKTQGQTSKNPGQTSKTQGYNAPGQGSKNPNSPGSQNQNFNKNKNDRH